MSEPRWTGSPADRETAEERRLAARDAQDGGDLERAISLLREAIALDPQASTYAWLGECLLAAGQTQEGLLHLAAGVGLGHNLFKARVALAEALYGLGEAFHRDALWHVEEALRVESNYLRARQRVQQWVGREPGLAAHLRSRTADLLKGTPARANADAAGTVRKRRRVRPPRRASE